MARKKTERVYQPISSMSHFAEKLASFGDSTAFRYYDHERKLTSITYEALSRRIKQQAAGYAAAGLAGKRIAIIGETSVEWVCSYAAAITAGGVAIPMDKELAAEEILGFLSFAEADAIVYSKTFNEKLASLSESHDTVSRVIPMLEKTGLSTGAVVAIVCGSVAVVAGGAAAALFVLKKKKIF